MFRSILKRLAPAKTVRSPKQLFRHVPTFDTLDRRDVPSASAVGAHLSHGVLKIEGTSGADTAIVSVSGAQIVLDLNGVQTSFDASRVRSIQFRGGAGDDVFTNNTDIRSLVFGGAGNDMLTGGGGRDDLRGDDGDDRLSGLAGDDKLDGGRGNDILLGGDGRDNLRGGAGNDDLQGEAGNDHLFGETGDDRLAGGVGDDRLFGHTGADILFGDDGNDDLRGGDGSDDLHGGAGSDDLFGDRGDDDLAGDADIDRIHGGPGSDQSDDDAADRFDDAENGGGPGGGLVSNLTESEPNSSKGTADRFVLDAAGMASLHGISTSHGDKDFFAFTAPSSGTLNISVQTSNGTFAQVEVETAGGVSLFETEPNNGINSGSLQVTAGTTYFIRLRAPDALAAAYDVSLSLV